MNLLLTQVIFSAKQHEISLTLDIKMKKNVLRLEVRKQFESCQPGRNLGGRGECSYIRALLD